jgi:hypothetical protein
MRELDLKEKHRQDDKESRHQTPNMTARFPLYPNALGTLRGEVARREEDGSIFVTFPGLEGEPLPAAMTGSARAALANFVKSSQDIPPVLLTFEGNDIFKPVVVDVLFDKMESAEELQAKDEDEKQRLTLTAEKEIELKCGKASLILTRAGKILLRGTYLFSRSSGVNKIKGGSVHIN